MFEKTRELLESGIENESGFCEFELDNKKREDIQALLTHLENLERMKELCRHGYFTTEKGKNAYCVDYIDGINEVKHFTGETFEQALSEAVKSLEEGKEAVK